MYSDKNKRENRKALKIFIPFMFLMAVIGGIIGAFSTTGAAKSIAVRAEEIIGEAIYIASPYIVIALTVAGILLAFVHYNNAKAEYKKSLGADDEDLQDTLYRRADSNLAKMIMYISACEILTLMFFAGVVAYLPAHVGGRSILHIVVVAVFIIGNFVRIKMQQMAVDFQKVLNPEKKGSIYDLGFRKKWEESCDEMEKFAIYKASYKAYVTGNKACAFLFSGLLLLSFFLDYGPLPAMAAGTVWLVMTVSYCREAIRLDNENLNL